MKSPKILYILNLANRVNNFSYTSMIAAKEIGFEYHIASNWSYPSDEERKADEEKYGIKIHQIDFNRSPYSPQNKKAYKQLKSLVEKEGFDIIHCNTPIGGVLGRLVGKKCKTNKVIYQAHGFHFFKGAPKRNWLLYYTVEKFLARYTDALITINGEDYALANKKMKLRKGGKVIYMPGVGVDVAKYTYTDDEAATVRKEIRESINIPDDAYVLISVGELNENKNNKTIISAMAHLKNPKIHYILCGVGEADEELKEQGRKEGLEDNLHFLGYRTDIDKLYQASDCLVMPSYREGLPRTIMEAMASGLPCLVSKIRGNIELIEDQNGGFMYAPDDYVGFANGIQTLIDNPEIADSMAKVNLENIKRLDNPVITEQFKKIYSEILM